MDAFTEAYIEAALWSSTHSTEDGDDVPFDQVDADISAALQREIETDCADFQEAQAALLEQAYSHPDVAYDESRAGHDFWLTRCGHGAGFWDRGLGEIGKKLSDAAHVYGNVDLYLGDDGLIYGQ